MRDSLKNYIDDELQYANRDGFNAAYSLYADRLDRAAKRLKSLHTIVGKVDSDVVKLSLEFAIEELEE